MGEREREQVVLLRRLAIARSALMREIQASQCAAQKTRTELETSRSQIEELRHQTTVTSNAGRGATLSAHLARATRSWLRARARRLEELCSDRSRLERMLADQLADLEGLKTSLEANLRGTRRLEAEQRALKLERRHFEEDQEEQSIRDRFGTRDRS